MAHPSAPPTSRAILFWTIVIVGLLVLRVPSLVEPAGGDQGLYGYSSQRILAGAVPYRDVWDQKPPGIMALYALLQTVWPHQSIVPIADLGAAAGTAILLVVLARRRGSAAVGGAAAAIFLLFGDPWLQRDSGVYVRGQCEPFIALAVTAALVLLASPVRRRAHLVSAGVLLAIAFWLKYNAATYGLPAALAVWAWAPPRATGRRVRSYVNDLFWIGTGFATVLAAGLVYFAWHHALLDLYLATITYNLHYSGETYRGFASVLLYPVTMPIARARTDMLWFLGGLGTLCLLWRLRSNRVAFVTIGWIVAACLSIAINGGRDLPNYFVQANPALALAAAAGLGSLALSSARTRAIVATILLVAFARVGDEPDRVVRLGGLPGLVSNLRFDLAYARGHVDRATYLARFTGQKFDALEIDSLAAFVDGTTAPADPVYVFGFSGGSVCWIGHRVSASRFFWSRPITIGFEADRPGYGARGLLADLERHAPALVALQKDEWQSETFFMSDDGLRGWLEKDYVRDHQTSMFDVWRKKTPAAGESLSSLRK